MLCVGLNAQDKRGIRAVWLTTAYGLDWPHSGISSSKAELECLLDDLKKLNINTVMFQCRIRGDVVYNSAIEPRNGVFDCFNYDPLAFAIEECHKRGMECHAWMVCIPVGSDLAVKKHGKNSIVNKQKKLVVHNKGNWFLDPSKSGTAEYLADLASEIVRKYDIDGIHLDYIRYPDDYKNFPSKYWASRKDAASERRDNISKIVCRISEKVRSIDNDIKISCAVIGKYRSTLRFSSKGWDAYDCLGQDVETWIKNGYVDVVYPMTYFKDNDFYPFVADWCERFGSDKVVPVLGAYRVDPREGDWHAMELVKQLKFCKGIGNNNVGFYRAEHLVRDMKGISSCLAVNDSPFIPLVPVCKEYEKKIEIPVIESFSRLGDFSWSVSLQKNNNVRKYILYASEKYPVDIRNPYNIVDDNIIGCNYKYVDVYNSEKFTFFAITAVDAYGNESEPLYITLPYFRGIYWEYIKSGRYFY